MKITKIEKINGIHHVTKEPNWLQKLFGVKTKVERYKTKGEVFHYFTQFNVFYRSDGSIVSPTDNMCKVLNNFENSF